MAGHVLQGRFLMGGPRLPTARPPTVGVAQPRAHGHAQPLPTGLISTGGGGRPLPDGVRQKMEAFFQADFADVRVHVGSEAPSIGALAFTLGSNLFFAPGQYNPETAHGQQLLGHELTHVLQQRAGRVSNPYGNGIAVVQDPALEAEADRMGQRAASHHTPPAVQAKSGPGAAGSGYRLIVGAYLHQGRDLPDAMAGHGFVAVEGPGGKRDAWGFSPTNLASMDAKRDLGRLTTGVPGQVHRDEAAFAKPGVRTRGFAISAEQAARARAKIADYQGGGQGSATFSLAHRQCTTFAGDVAKAAGVDGFATARNPRDFYRKI